MQHNPNTLQMDKRKLNKVEKENQKRKLDPDSAEAYRNRLVPVDKRKLNLGNSVTLRWFKAVDILTVDDFQGFSELLGELS